MSIFIPYSSSDVLSYLTTLFNLSYSNLSDYELTILTIFCNLYFFIYWFIIIYFALKLFNRIWERFL